MTGTVNYEICATGKRRIKSLRIDGTDQSVAAWARDTNQEPTTILHKLKTMAPREAVFSGACLIRPHNAWPVPERVRRAS